MPNLNIVVSADLKRWLKHRAREEDRTLSKYVANVLAEHKRSTDAGAAEAATTSTKGD